LARLEKLSRPRCQSQHLQGASANAMAHFGAPDLQGAHPIIQWPGGSQSAIVRHPQTCPGVEEGNRRHPSGEPDVSQRASPFDAGNQPAAATRTTPPGNPRPASHVEQEERGIRLPGLSSLPHGDPGAARVQNCGLPHKGQIGLARGSRYLTPHVVKWAFASLVLPSSSAIGSISLRAFITPM